MTSLDQSEASISVHKAKKRKIGVQGIAVKSHQSHMEGSYECSILMMSIPFDSMSVP